MWPQGAKLSRLPGPFSHQSIYQLHFRGFRRLCLASLGKDRPSTKQLGHPLLACRFDGCQDLLCPLDSQATGLHIYGALLCSDYYSLFTRKRPNYHANDAGGDDQDAKPRDCCAEVLARLRPPMAIINPTKARIAPMMIKKGRLV